MKKIEILLKNFLLRVLLLFKTRNKKDSYSFNSNSKILFIRLNRIGDALVVTPLLKVVKDHLKCKIYLLADNKNHFVFTNNPSIDKVIIFEKGLQGFLETIRMIKAEQFDAIVDLHDDVSTTVSFLLAFSSCKNIFGLQKENEAVYTKTTDRLEPTKTHIIDRTLELTKLFNINYNRANVNVHYFPKAESQGKVKNILKRKGLTNKFLVGINISAGSDARFWGVERFQNLIKFLSGYDLHYVILSTTRDIKLALKILNEKQKNLYTPSFDGFAAMISELDLLFTPDTSAIHIASAFSVPVFGLYVNYKTDDMIWSPYKSDFDCNITTQPTLAKVEYDEVIKKFQPFLEKHLI
ncbi:MAG: glycosyltransferase family 9 protein [Ignavibacteriales bacterium]|nr:glycosyltransferase family 9 protein [Ignavibacteriales bacterium]